MTGILNTSCRRIIAFGVDWLVIVAWAGLLFGMVMFFTSGEPSRPSSPWISQAISFVSMTLPVLLYFSVSEASSYQSTLGKRLLGLEVKFKQANQAPFGVTLCRNAIKFLPWEIGHFVAFQAAFSGAIGISLWVYSAMAASLLLPVWWIGAMFYTGLTPYDRLTSTQVVRATQVPSLYSRY